jgi:hypothetical protein
MSQRISSYIYYLLLVLIIAFSAYYYLPCFYSFFNSDMAIHVLMSKDFQLPRDYYYWGQNRLGSLLPMVSHAIYTVVKVHPIYICGIVNYLFLLIPFLLIARHILNSWLRLALACLVFLPFNSFNALLYVGHPYSQQFFCGTLFILFFLKARQLVLARQRQVFVMKEAAILCAWLFASIVFFVLGVWVSEFDAILILIPLISIPGQFKKYRSALTLKQVSLLAGFCLLLLVGGYKWFQYTKQVSVPDDQYNKAFITDGKSISAEYDFMVQKIKAVFDYSNPDLIIENTIYIVLFLLIVFLLLKRKELRMAGNNIVSKALLLTSLVASVVLFFSFWNFRSEFCPRYYIPVYLMLSIALLWYFDKIRVRFLKPLFFLIVLSHCVTYSYLSLIRHKVTSPFEKYADFHGLPKGTLIADYWESYLIQAVAIDNLQSINFDGQLIRISRWRQIPLSETRFYFLNNENAKKNGLKDTLIQFGIPFVFTGQKYPLRAAEVLEYRKLSTNSR